MGMGNGRSDGLSRRDFLKVAGVTVGTAGLLGQPGFADSGTGQEEDVARASRRHPRSVLPENASGTLRELQEFIDEIPVIDTHEHLQPEQGRIESLQGRLDFSLLVSHYANNDLDSAGISRSDREALFGKDISVDRKWQIFAPYWDKMKNTGYGWAVDLAVRGYYGLDGLSANTYTELTGRIREEYRPGLYNRVFNAAGIERAIVDINTENVDRTLFSPALRVDDYITISKPADMERFSRINEKEVKSPKDITEALQHLMKDWKQKRIPTAKSAMAYRRTLQVDHISEADAQRSLDILLTRGETDAIKSLQDFIFHQILQACSDQNMPIQIHTGILAGTNYGHLERTNPMHLCDALARYPRAKVSIFHAGYPWNREVAAMGKTYTAVYADLCWTHVISPISARTGLHEWLDAMPASKIFAFGGDYLVAECTYGHAVIARTNVGQVLAERVESGRMSMGDAKQVAQMILRENALHVFELQ